MSTELSWSKERREHEYDSAVEFLLTMGLPSPKSRLLYPLNDDRTSAGEPIESGALVGGKPVLSNGSVVRPTSPIMTHIPDALYSRNQFHPNELKEFQNVFAELDVDGDGHINSQDLGVVLDKLGVHVSKNLLDGIIAEVDLDKNGSVEFNEFLEVMSSVKEIQIRKEFARIVASLEERKELSKREAAAQEQARGGSDKGGPKGGWWHAGNWDRGGKDGKGEKISTERSGGGV
ncbi:hypothetical protein BC936DRAFT_138894 [Jimgerdemannia flammicorona]|nr:hypothetical protein BC936DRAFT_138894 [Jimgerdemannia flammicorona]